MEISHLLSLVHHLESDWVEQMISCLVNLDPLLLVELMIMYVLLHHLHDLPSLLLFLLFLFLLLLFILSH
jgi:hypothetical protein